jgi:hypothetical protein
MPNTLIPSRSITPSIVCRKSRYSKFEGKDVYLDYNNDAYGYAVKNGLTLKAFLDQGS